MLLEHLKQNRDNLEKAFTTYTGDLKNNFRITLDVDNTDITAVITESEFSALLDIVNEYNGFISLTILNDEDFDFIETIFDYFYFQKGVRYQVVEFGVFIGSEV